MGVFGWLKKATKVVGKMAMDAAEEPSRYSPNPEWMGPMDLVDSRMNAQILAPQFLKQAQESAKILSSTTEPSVFFMRYDFCVGRLIQLEDCKKYGVKVTTTSSLEKYLDLTFREKAVNEIVSLLVLLTGCASTKKETDLAKPVAEDSSNPVTLTVYLTAHYANPDTHCPIYEKLLDYQKENPNITIQFVSPKEGDTAEREAEIHQLNTEILSGKGPDLFIMEGNRLTNVNLFPDIEKSMMNGAFLDLTDVMDSNEFTAENFYMPLLDAGKLKGKQYILPLCFSVPALTSAESILKDSGFDMQAASKSLVATMDELLRIYKEKPMLVVTDFSMTSALSQPIIDYKNHTINLDTASCRQTLAYEKEFRTGEISYEMQNGLFDSFNPEVVQDYFANGEPFASLDPSYMTVGLLRQCAALGIKTVTLPIPNELGGVTAEIGSYAMGNRNTKHPAEVKALLAYLLSEECQSSSAFADKDMFPVRRGCLKKCMEAQYQFSVYDASHEKIGQEDIEKRKEMYGDNLTDAQLDQLETICDKINAAQYHTIWYRALQLDQSEDGGNLLSETMVQYWNDEITLDELVDRLTPRLKLYLDE